jgi:serine/threonine-protein kinase HipA
VNPFPERARELNTWVSEEAGPDATIDALMSVVAYFRLPMTRAREILDGVERAVARWRKVGRKLGITATELDQFADAFEHPEREQARRQCTR